MKKLLAIFIGLLISIIGIVSCNRVNSTIIQENKNGKGAMMNVDYETAVFGGGCFWCLETLYLKLNGVVSVTSGYAGGTEKDPTYQRVCAGFTGHAEVVQILFDPRIISYEKLLEIFWDMHDPTLVNRQGNDVGSQYRSIILYTNKNQEKIAEEMKQKLMTAHRFENPIVTEIQKLEKFFPAEDYHQNYYNENSIQPYCSVVIAPKVKYFIEKYKNLLINNAREGT